MPKIDPSQLLDCLDPLLGSEGGIKDESVVIRLAVLMTKFSKNLVSKCIYILILKNTEPDLLAKFMAEGGWALVFQWLDDGICNNNYPLIREILELLLKCPISLDRLKENNCPKVVKGLSKDSECEEVKRLAGKLVEQWLKFIKSGQAAISDVAMAAVSTPITVLPSNVVVSTVQLNPVSNSEVKKPTITRKIAAKPGIQIVRKVTTSEEEDAEEEEEEEQEEEEDEDDIVPPIGSLPLYKITVRDGKSVLAKVGTKTLTLPVKKKESEIDSGTTVTSVVLKTDPITKKIRYVTKPVSEKDKGDAGADEKSSSNIQKSISISSESLSKSKIVVLPEKNEVKKVEEVSKAEKTSESKGKTASLKSQKDVSKSKDSQNKVSKSSRDNENYKSEFKHKDKEKKSSSSSSSSSSSRTSSDKDKKKSEHKSHKTDKSRDRDRDRERERSKDKLKRKDKESSSSSSSSSSKDRHKDGDRERDRDKYNKDKESKPSEKSLSASEKAQIQADKDKNTLERLKTPAISLLGKIPKKPSSQSASSAEKSAASPVNKPSDSSEESGGDGKKLSDQRTPKVRPKTVKTYNSKFRSTGLEEEIKPPPPRSSLKKKMEEKRPPLPLKPEQGKTTSTTTTTGTGTGTKDGVPPEKKPKLGDVVEVKKENKAADKPSGVKLIPMKPKPALLESDMFSDALTASTKLEPRKRKRRTSSSKEAPEAKKESKEEANSNASPDVNSPRDVKPSLKFYRDTLEDDEEKNKENAGEGNGAEPKAESDSEDSSKQTSSGESQDGGKPGAKLYPNGVLVCKTKKGPKKSVKWKEGPELTSVRHFELDETERVNVTRTFVDMKLMERTHEREAFQLARKLATEDVMEERVRWGPLYEVDIPPEKRSTVEPGKSSLEKNVQYAREKTVLQAIYFHRNLIPDSPAEPDHEIHPTTDPKIIPLDDITGNSDSVCNFQNIPWPEPKPTLSPSSPPTGQHGMGIGPHGQQQHPQLAGQPGQLQQQQQQQLQQQQQQHPQQGFPAGYSSAGNFPGYNQMAVPGMMPPGQGNWRPGDGKEMGMNMPFQPNGPLCPQMGQPPNMYNPGTPEGFAMNGPPMGGFNPGYPMPCDPNAMYGPPMGPMGMGGPPPGHQWNRGGAGGWQGGGRPFMGPMNVQQKFQKGVCHHFAKFGNCARGSSCRFMHPN